MSKRRRENDEKLAKISKGEETEKKSNGVHKTSQMNKKKETKKEKEIEQKIEKKVKENVEKRTRRAKKEEKEEEEEQQVEEKVEKKPKKSKKEEKKVEVEEKIEKQPKKSKKEEKKIEKQPKKSNKEEKEEIEEEEEKKEEATTKKRKAEKETKMEEKKTRDSKQISDGKQEEDELPEEPTSKAAPKRRKLDNNQLMQELRNVRWQDLDFVGLEINGANPIYKEKFSFPDLQRELTEGCLSGGPFPVYLFMGAQPIDIPGASPSESIINIPYIVAIQCQKEPSGRIAVASIQKGGEELLTGRKSHYRWVPYFPKGYTNNVDQMKVVTSQVQTLKYEGRREAAKRYNDTQRHQVSLLLPYELLPQMFEQKTLQERQNDVKSVEFIFTAENGKNVEVCWDKDCHKLAIDVDSIIEDEGLDPKEGDRLKVRLKQEFVDARDRVKQQYETEKRELDSLSPEDLQALRDMRVYKFYPVHDTIDIPPYMDPKINRYYGNAHRTFPQVEGAGSKMKVILPPAPLLESTDSQSQSIDSGFTPSFSTGFVPSTGFGFVPSTGFVPNVSNNIHTGDKNEIESTPSVVPVLASTASEFKTSSFSMPTGNFTQSSLSGGFIFNSSTSSSSSTEGFFPVSSASSTRSADSWVCASCTEVNSNSIKTCKVCMVDRLK